MCLLDFWDFETSPLYPAWACIVCGQGQVQALKAQQLLSQIHQPNLNIDIGMKQHLPGHPKIPAGRGHDLHHPHSPFGGDCILGKQRFLMSHSQSQGRLDAQLPAIVDHFFFKPSNLAVSFEVSFEVSFDASVSVWS